MALTDVQVKTAKPREKDYKLTDGDGLFLLVAATGDVSSTASGVKRNCWP